MDGGLANETDAGRRTDTRQELNQIMLQILLRCLWIRYTISHSHCVTCTNITQQGHPGGDH